VKSLSRGGATAHLLCEGQVRETLPSDPIGPFHQKVDEAPGGHPPASAPGTLNPWLSLPLSGLPSGRSGGPGCETTHGFVQGLPGSDDLALQTVCIGLPPLFPRPSFMQDIELDPASSMAACPFSVCPITVSPCPGHLKFPHRPSM